MDVGAWVALAVVLPFVSALLSPLVERLRSQTAPILASASGAASFAILIAAWMTSGPLVVSYSWVPTVGLGFTLRLDALGLLFSLLITGAGAVILAYSYGYMAREGDRPRFYAYMSLFMGSMLGLALAGDLILLFVFWELTTISSFLLIGFRRDQAGSVSAALKALLITGLGGLALLVSFLLVWSVVGSFEVGRVLTAGAALQASPLLLPILLLFVVAVAAKSAQFPLHVWLPDAMVAPTPVSAYLHSAAMVKAGVYLLVRFLPVLSSVEWTAVVLPLGMVTMILGGLLAIRSVDLKRILAYSTISQLGLMASALGLASTASQEAGLLHLVNHAVMKASLFLVAGGVTLATGVADIRNLGGLRYKMPLTALAAGMAAFSMAGLPPFGGFLSKEVYFESALESGMIWAPVLAVLGGSLTFAYSLYFFSRIFLGRRSPESAAESPLLSIPALILAGLTLVLGVFPDLVTGFISSVAHPSGVGVFAPSLLLPSASGLAMSGASIALGLVILWKYEVVAAGLNSLLRALGGATPNGVYEGLVGVSRRVAATLGYAVQNGSIRRYSGVLVLFVLLSLIWPLSFGPLELPAVRDARDISTIVILVALVVFAALAAFFRDVLHAVLSLSGMGFLLAMTFMFLNAPDLAMTQILVEMVFLVIFLIVLYKIPFRAIQPSRPRGPLDGLLALGIVIGVTLLVGMSLSAFLLPSVATYYLDRPAELTGGDNVVNIVVTNFRAFDTLGEITVIVLASLAVYTLLRRWRSD